VTPISGYRDVGVASVIQPADTIMTCSPFVPVVDIVNNDDPPTAEICTVAVDIWRYRMKMDSLCHISYNPADSVLAYTASVVVSVNPGHNEVSMVASWHPTWSDVYWVGGHHVSRVKVRMSGDMNPNNDYLRKIFIVKARSNDLQMNYVGLLLGNTVVRGDTINADNTYNTVSVVSNSPFGPVATFRIYYKIVKIKDNAIVYSRYLDKTINAGIYSCCYFQSGWGPDDSGWYRASSWIQTRPGVDMVSDNNSIERLFYARISGGGNTAARFSTSPTIFALFQNNPNPFLKTTAIQWQIPIASKVTVSIYDITGRNIKTLVNDKYNAGLYRTTWDRTDDNNQKVSAGIYFYEMRADNYISRHKMVITH
jgi:hypothetical protein